MNTQTEEVTPNVAPGSLVDIAVLDDDADFLHYIEDLLRDEGTYSVRTFGHPDELLLGCEQRVPDIVLVDMKMGEFTGESVIVGLRARHPSICIVVVTGYPSLEDMRATFKLNVFDYLTKPFSLAQLRQTLKNAIDAFGLGQAPHVRLRGRLGHRIKMLRVEREWSLKDLAGAAHLSVSQVSSIERGAHLPSIESLLGLCRAIGKRPSEILSSIDF